jgi:hypothetical protein
VLVQPIGHRVPGVLPGRPAWASLGMFPQDAEKRLKILHFFDQHGLEATRDAFGVSRRPLYRWKTALKAGGGNPVALAPGPAPPGGAVAPRPMPGWWPSCAASIPTSARPNCTCCSHLGAPSAASGFPASPPSGASSPAPPTRCAMPPHPHRQSRPHQTPAPPPQTQKAQAGERQAARSAGLRHRRAPLRRHAPLPRDLHRPRLALRLRLAMPSKPPNTPPRP